MSRLALARFAIAALGLRTISSTGRALTAHTQQAGPDRSDPACAFAGDRSTIDGFAQCVCQAGYSGTSCESCAAGFERDLSGACQVTDARRHLVREFGLTVAPPHAIALTGIPVAELVSFDQAMIDFMKGRGIRAGVLAVAKDGQLVLSRGYGFMDRGADADPFVHDEGGVGLVAPSTPMRIASITKPITAAAIREALAAQQLDTTLPALPFVNASLGVAQTSLAELVFPFTPNGSPHYVETDLNPAYENCLSLPDSRWDDITIQDLLGHRGGFNRDLSPSPRWTGGFLPPPSLSNPSYNPQLG